MNCKGPAAAAAAASLLLAAACGGGDDGSAANACSVAAEKSLVLDRTSNQYLFLELLPASIDPAPFATADDLLDAMTATARAQSKDRFFSHIASIAAEQQFFAGGESVGFGVSTKTNTPPTRAFIAQVFSPSPAASAGFMRGDEILQIGETSANMVDVSVLLATPTGFNDALGPAQAGITRAFRVRPVGGGADGTRTVTKGTFSLDPVPAPAPIIIQRAGLSPVGYLNFRTFISTADNLLRNAFAQFRAQNVRDIIIDLRYNGGGLVSTAEILGSLLAQQAANGNQLMHRTQFNSRRTPVDVRFRIETQAIDPVTIVFLTTGSSASASELLINALTPYANTAIVGERSFGKPVGQEAFDLQGCDTRLRLVTFKTVNSAGYGDYFTGLHPDSGFVDAFCPATDDLLSPQGDPAEDMTGAALSWINNQQCPPPLAPKLGAAAPERLTDLPLPRRPAPEQVYQPGFM